MESAPLLRCRQLNSAGWTRTIASDVEAKARLRETITSAQQEADERGLTEEELERLLADES
jgi:hypothetical protein